MTIETSDGRAVPPPTEADLAIDLSYTSILYEQLGGQSVAAGIVRRCHAAESEVRRLRERVAELEAGLRPFANCADTFVARTAPDSLVVTVNMGQCRRADELLAKGTGS